MTLDLGLLLVCILGVGFLAQWLAWRVKLPAILFLLLAGILMGPVIGVLAPDKLLGPLLFPIVSLAVSVILFEGSLTLRFSELPDIGRAVRGLVTYGAVIAVLMLAVAAHYFAGLSWEVALLFGALTCVTGPTVIAPMLRTVRPNARIANTLRWEGIVIDPLGALFAVLVYEAIVSRQQGHTLGIFLAVIASGVVIGLLAAWTLAFLLRRQLIPEYLQNYGALVTVLLAFSLSNAITHESGLLTVTVMGIALGNMRGVHIDDILDFKENLTTLLVSSLFILLAARLSWPLPDGMLWAGIAIFIVAQLIVRPVTATIASIGSTLNWRERALIAWVAPRGIVAAAVSALFALKLDALGMEGAKALVPLVFILIIGTVVLQSATARPLARWLKVAEPDPTGVLIYGADQAARVVARALADAGFQVIVADEHWDGIKHARMEGLPTFFGYPASAYAERHLDLTGIGRLLAMSTNRERNALACVYYRQEFGRGKVYRLSNDNGDATGSRLQMGGDLSAPALFGDGMTHERFLERLAEGWRIKSTRLTSTFDWPNFIEQYGSPTVLLFGVEEKGALRVSSAKRELEPRPGWTVIALVPPQSAS
ncbi:cation:proton antiporter [Dyella kyungheensis]|jgi:NhaP-type Na+/H+ or K+/H+ antiporter|uniref:Sodium:proton antiporter n=1 Tax=Dyella kyungheensis TaxID=1242174 RepID=A0ABS2JMA7_9GAMM|nr:sodium:proton antiporter [Dyella kyungheensis]MBM7120172.1 sodium:proton antiporter [Dyella kyungheensis]